MENLDTPSHSPLSREKSHLYLYRSMYQEIVLLQKTFSTSSSSFIGWTVATTTSRRHLWSGSIVATSIGVNHTCGPRNIPRGALALLSDMNQKKGYTQQSQRHTKVDSMGYSSYSSVAVVATCLWWQHHSPGSTMASAWTFSRDHNSAMTAPLWLLRTDRLSCSIRPIPAFTQQRYASSVVRASYRPPDYTIDDDDDDNNETLDVPNDTTKLEESDDILPTTRRRPRIVRATTRISGSSSTLNVNTFDDDDDDYDYDDDDDNEVERSKMTRKTGTKTPTTAPKRNTTKKVNVDASSSSSSSASWMDRNTQFMNTIGKVAADHPKSTTTSSTTTRGTFIRSSAGSSDTATTTGLSRLRNSSNQSKNYNIRGDNNNNSETHDDDEVNRTFREDFRGTRVFVQGLPESCKWQDLKDHFRVAGKVVFASVSSGLDPNTNRPKGHGIVQFETTAEARTAIRIMRDHPLNGSTLYVREDIQEDGNSNRPVRTGSSNGDHYDDDADEDDESNTSDRPKGPTPPSKWKCADTEMAAQHLDPESIQKVFQILKARNQARRRRNYEACDAMREELKNQYNVHIDDRLTMWWIGAAPPNVVDQVQNIGRWKDDGTEHPEPGTSTRGPPPTEWRQIMTTKENDACIDPDLIMGLLKQRDIARREKDFSTADTLLLQAQNAPSEAFLTLRIHDESKTWRVWSDQAPARPNPVLLSKESPPAEQCISLCLEHAPDKVDEVRQLLFKFPGREYNILKKLKQRYLNQ